MLGAVCHLTQTRLWGHQLRTGGAWQHLWTKPPGDQRERQRGHHKQLPTTFATRHVIETKSVFLFSSLFRKSSLKRVCTTLRMNHPAWNPLWDDTCMALARFTFTANDGGSALHFFFSFQTSVPQPRRASCALLDKPNARRNREVLPDKRIRRPRDQSLELPRSAEPAALFPRTKQQTTESSTASAFLRVLAPSRALKDFGRSHLGTLSSEAPSSCACDEPRSRAILLNGDTARSELSSGAARPIFLLTWASSCTDGGRRGFAGRRSDVGVDAQGRSDSVSRAAHSAREEE